MQTKAKATENDVGLRLEQQGCKAIKIFKDVRNKGNGQENVRIRKNLRLVKIRGLCQHIDSQCIYQGTFRKKR